MSVRIEIVISDTLIVDKATGDREQQSKRVFGDGVLAIRWDGSDSDFVFDAVSEVNVIKAGGASADQFELGKLFQEFGVKFGIDKTRENLGVFDTSKVASF